MARGTDKRADGLEAENTGGVLSGFLAEEDVFDRRALWRLGAWGVASVGAVVLAVYANQSATTARREQLAVAQQAEQIQRAARESQSEARRLASAIETLNSDRDRLYSRVTVLEQGLETATGAIAKQQVAASPLSTLSPASTVAVPAAPASDPQPAAQKQPQAQSQPPAPTVSPVATTTSKASDKPSDKPLDKAVDKPNPVAATAPEPAPATVAAIAQKPSNPPATAATPAATTTAGATGLPAITTPPAITPAPSLMAGKSMMGPPDPAASKLIEPEKPPTPDKAAAPEKQAAAEKPEQPEKADKPTKTITVAPMPEIVASAPPTDDAEADAAKSLPKLPVQRTEFGLDVGGANSVGGLRALWRGLLKSRSNAALTTLRPIIVIKEGSNGLGMQLRLVAGPLDDAAAAAKICAGMIENQRPCTTTVFDGQRLIMNADEQADDKQAADKPAATRPAASRYFVHRRASAPPKRVAVEEPPKKPDPPSGISSFFRRATPQQTQ